MIELVLAPLPWLWEVPVVMVAGHAVGLSLSPMVAFALITAANLGTVLPVPGGAGSFEAAGAFALAGAGVPHHLAFAFVLLYHLSLLVPMVVAGVGLWRCRGARSCPAGWRAGSGVAGAPCWNRGVHRLRKVGSVERIAPCPVCKKPAEPLVSQSVLSLLLRPLPPGRPRALVRRGVPGAATAGGERGRAAAVAGRPCRRDERLRDLHCHLLPGVDDGARTPEDALEMARALVDLGFSTVRPSPHARAGVCPGRGVRGAAGGAARGAGAEAGVPLALEPNAENVPGGGASSQALGTPSCAAAVRGDVRPGGAAVHLAGAGAPGARLPDELKGVTPLLAHPERCLEFERPGRAAEVVAPARCCSWTSGR